MKYFLFMILSVFFCTSASAERSPAENEYISSVFNGSPPPIKKILIKGELKIGMKSIMGSTYRKLRIKYWEKDLKTLWILESIGKYEPITAGFVLSKCKILDAKVLVYREQIGWEVKYPSFLKQFNGATLGDNLKLKENIDGISGATLSVRSMDRMARAALLLHQNASDLKCS